MRYCITYIADDKVQAYFKDLTEHLSAKFGISNLSKRIPAHITLKYPFETEDTTEIETRIEHIAKTIMPVSFKVGGVNRFDDGFETIFIEVEHSPEFKNNIVKCISGLGEFDEDRKFEIENRTFHISIARHLDSTTSDTIFEYLNAEGLPWLKNFDVAFDNITLMKYGDEVWSVKKMFKIENAL